MSSKTTEPVQPETSSAADPASPTDIVEILAADEEPGTAESADPVPAAGTAGPGGAVATTGTGIADDEADADATPQTPVAETTTAETTTAETPLGDSAGDGEVAGEAKEPAAIEAVEAGEPTELIEMSEPVELAEPVEPTRRGHGLLLAGAFLVAVVLIVGAAIGIVGALTHGFRKPAPIVTYKTSPVFGLRTGECVDTNGQRFSVVSCAAPHDAEVFATFRLAGVSWPGTAKVRTAASAGCESRVSGYLNPQLALSLASTYVYPGQVAWQAGTRTVICEVRATSGQLTGSVRTGAGAPA